MNNKKSNFLPPFGLSSEESSTSSSSLISSDKNNIQSTEQLLHLKETKTHLFCLIPSNNENTENPKKNPQLIRIKISKRRPQSRYLKANKVFDCSSVKCGVSNLELLASSNQQKIRKFLNLETSSSGPVSNSKKTGYPSFIVLPKNKKHGEGITKKKFSRNQSTSDNSNETYVIRSKEENKLLPRRATVGSQTSFGSNVFCPTISNDNEIKATGTSLYGLKASGSTESKLEDYCECAKGVARRPIDSLNRTSDLGKIKDIFIVEPKEQASFHLKSLNSVKLFRIKFNKPTQANVSLRLKAGQDHEDKNYKERRYTCPKVNRIFPPEGSSARRDELHSNYSESVSSVYANSSNDDILKINYYSVRRCLKCSSANEKCKVLDALRMRIKSKTLNVGIDTVQDIVKFDLFGVQCECRSRPILEDLLWPISDRIPNPLQTSIARLINAMVSYEIGRDYFDNRSIISLLTWGNSGRDNIDEEMADNLMAIMMKLSTNRFQCADMIKKGLLKWLVNHMEEVEYSASTYHLKCMTGLLRILLSVESLIDLSLIEMRRWLVLLGRYLDNNNIDVVRRNILASVLTLLQIQGAVKCANEINFTKIIQKHIETSSHLKENDYLRKINQLLTGQSNVIKSRSSAIRLAKEDMYLDDEMKSVSDVSEDYYSGEKLLREKFGSRKEEHSSVESRTTKVNFQETKNRHYKRQEDDHLISRVFVEHLHCLLPNIDRNRIFPMFNYRSSDKPPQTCLRIDDPPTPRPPYVLASRERAKDLRDKLSRQEKQASPEQLLIDEIASTPKIDNQLSAEKLHELSATIANDQELTAGESKVLQDEVFAEQKSNQQSSLGATETKKDEITFTPRNDQESSAEEHETLKDEQKSDHILSAIAKETSQDELNAAKPETLSDEVLAEQKSDKQLSAGATEAPTDELTFIPQNDQELSAGETETLKDEQKQDNFLSAIATETSQDESTAAKPQTLSHELLAEQKSDEQTSIGASHTAKNEFTAIPTSDHRSTRELETLQNEVLAQQEYDQEISVAATETSKNELPVRPENDQELSAGEPETLSNEVLAEQKSDQQLTVGVTEALKDELIARPKNDQLAAGESEALKEQIAKQRSDQEILEGEMETSKEIPRPATDQLTARVTEALKDELIARPTNDELAAGEPETLKEQIAKQRSDQQILLGKTETPKEIPRPATGQELSTGEPKILKDENLAEQNSDENQSAGACEALTDELTATSANDQLADVDTETMKEQPAEQKSNQDILVGEAGESETLIDAAKQKSDQQEKVVYAGSERKLLPRSVELLRDGGISTSVSDQHLMMDPTRKSQKQTFSAVRSHQQLSPRSAEMVRDDKRESDLLPTGATRNSKETIRTVRSYQQVRTGSLEILKDESIPRSNSNEQSGISNKSKEQLVPSPKSDRQLLTIPVDALNEETIDKASSDILLPDDEKTDQYLSAEATQTFQNELTAGYTKDEKLAAEDLKTLENEQKCDQQLSEAVEGTSNNELTATHVKDQELSAAEAKTLKADVDAEQKNYQELLAAVTDTSKEVVSAIPANDQKLCAVEPETLTDEISAEPKSDQLLTAEATETVPANDEALLASEPQTHIDEVLAEQKSAPQISVGATETSKDELTARPEHDQELSAEEPETLKDEIAVKQKCDPQFSAREMEESKDEFTVRPENGQELSAVEPETLKDDGGKQNDIQQLSTTSESSSKPELVETLKDETVSSPRRTLKDKVGAPANDEALLASEPETHMDEVLAEQKSAPQISVGATEMSKDELTARPLNDQEFSAKEMEESKDEFTARPENDEEFTAGEPETVKDDAGKQNNIQKLSAASGSSSKLELVETLKYETVSSLRSDQEVRTINKSKEEKDPRIAVKSDRLSARSVEDARIPKRSSDQEVGLKSKSNDKRIPFPKIEQKVSTTSMEVLEGETITKLESSQHLSIDTNQKEHGSLDCDPLLPVRSIVAVLEAETIAMLESSQHLSTDTSNQKADGSLKCDPLLPVRSIVAYDIISLASDQNSAVDTKSSNQEAASVVESADQFSARSIETAVYKRASEHHLPSSTIRQSKEKTFVDQNNEQLPEESVEVLKGEAITRQDSNLVPVDKNRKSNMESVDQVYDKEVVKRTHQQAVDVAQLPARSVELFNEEITDRRATHQHLADDTTSKSKERPVVAVKDQHLLPRSIEMLKDDTIVKQASDELTAKRSKDQQLSAEEAKTLKNDVAAEQKSDRQLTAGVTELLKDELIARPTNDQLAAEEPETLKEQTAKQKSDQQILLGETETSKEIPRPATAQELSEDQKQSAGAAEALNDELTAALANDQLAADEPEKLRDQLAGQKSDHKILAGEAGESETLIHAAKQKREQDKASYAGNEHNLLPRSVELVRDQGITRSVNDRQLMVDTTRKSQEQKFSNVRSHQQLLPRSVEMVRDDKRASLIRNLKGRITTVRSDQQVRIGSLEILKNESIPRSKSNEQPGISNKSKEQLVPTPKSDPQLSTIPVDTLNDETIDKASSGISLPDAAQTDQHLSAEGTETFKNELTAKSTTDEKLAAGDLETANNEQKINQQLTEGTSNDEFTANCAKDQELFAEAETLKDDIAAQQKSDQQLPAGVTEALNDELTATPASYQLAARDPQTVKEQFAKQKSDHGTLVGEAETLKKIRRTANDQELFAREPETHKDEVLSEQKNDQKQTAGVTEALKDELIARPTNDELAAGEPEALKEQIGKRESDQQIVLEETETSKEIPRPTTGQESSNGGPKIHEVLAERKSHEKQSTGATMALSDGLTATPANDQLAARDPKTLKEQFAEQKSDEEILAGETETLKKIPGHGNDQKLSAGEPETHKDEVLSEHKSDQQLSAGVTEALNDELVARTTNDQLAAGEPETLKEQIAEQKSDQQILLGETETSKEIPRPATSQELSTGEPKILKGEVLVEQKSDQKKSCGSTEALSDDLTATLTNDQLATRDAETLKEQIAKYNSDQKILVGEAGESGTLIDAAKQKREQEEVFYAGNEQTLLPRSVELVRDRGISRSVSAVQSHRQLSPRSVEMVRDDKQASHPSPAGAITTSKETITTVRSDQQVRIGSLEILKDESFLRSKSNEQPGNSNKSKQQLVPSPKSDRQLSTIPVDTLNDETIQKAASYISLPGGTRIDQCLSAEATQTFKNEVTARSTKDEELAAGGLETVKNKEKSGQQLSEGVEGTSNADLTVKRARDQEELSAGATKTLKDDVAAEQKCDQQLLAGVIDTSKDLVTAIPANDQNFCDVEPETLTDEVPSGKKSDQLLTAEATETLKDKVSAAPANDEALLAAEPETVIDEVLAEQKSDPQLSVGATETLKEELTARPLHDQELSPGEPETLKDEVAVKQKCDPQFSAREVEESKDELTARPENDQELSAGEPETLKDDADKQNDIQKLSITSESSSKPELVETQKDETVSSLRSDQEVRAIKKSKEEKDPRIAVKSDRLSARSVEDARIPKRSSNQEVGLKSISNDDRIRFTKIEQKLLTKSMEILEGETITKLGSSQHLSIDTNQIADGNLNCDPLLPVRSIVAVLEGGTIALLESSQHLSIDTPNQEADGSFKCDPLLPVRSIVPHEIKRLESDQDSAVDIKSSNQEAASVVEIAGQLSARSIEAAVYKRASEHHLPSSTIRQTKEKTLVNQKSNEQLPEESVEALNSEVITRQDSTLAPVDKNRKSNMESVDQVYDKDVVKRTYRSAADAAQLTPRSVEIFKDEIIDRRATNQNLAADTTSKSKERPVVAVKDQHLLPRSTETLKDDNIDKQASDHPIPAAMKGKTIATGSAVLNSLDEAVCTPTHTLADNRGNVVTNHISSSTGSVMIYRDEGIVRKASDMEQGNTLGKRKENQVDSTKNNQKLSSRSVDFLKDDEIDKRSGHPSPAGIVKKSSLRNDHQLLPESLERLKEEEIAVSSITKSKDQVVASPRSSQHLLARSIIFHDRAFESTGSDQKRPTIFTGKSKVGASNIVIVRSVEKMMNESTSKMPPIDQTVNESPHSAIHSTKVSNKKSKIKTADSNIWREISREMLNNDQLLNKLCDKVLKKVVAENKFCGPNCKSPCGGLNPHYESNKDKADKDKGDKDK